MNVEAGNTRGTGACVPTFHKFVCQVLLFNAYIAAIFPC